MAVCYKSRDYCYLAIIIITMLVCINASSVADDEPWYTNPCNKAIRHSRSATRSQLLSTLRVLTRIIKKDIKDLYRKIPANKAHIKWFDITKEMKILYSNTTSSMQKFKSQYDILQKLAYILDKLMNWKVDTSVQMFNHTARIEMFKKAIYSLRVLMCEYHEKIHKQHNPLQMDKDLYQFTLLTRNTVDLTELVNYDITFFRKFKNVLQKFQKKKSGRRTNKSEKKKNNRLNNVK